jgi:hypothetical protein
MKVYPNLLWNALAAIEALPPAVELAFLRASAAPFTGNDYLAWVTRRGWPTRG